MLRFLCIEWTPYFSLLENKATSSIAIMQLVDG